MAQNTLQRLIKHNWKLKLTALGLSVCVYALIHGSEDMQGSVWVDVIAQLPAHSSGVVLVSEVPSKVRVTIRGTRSLVSSVLKGNIAPVQIDLRDASKKVYSFDPDDFGLPAGVTVVELSPASFSLRWGAR